MDKKWMLKIYAGKKISLIRENTTMDFVSVAFSIYHCFFLSGSHSGGVRCWLHLSLGSLLSDYQRSAVSSGLLQLLISHFVLQVQA